MFEEIEIFKAPGFKIHALWDGQRLSLRSKGFLSPLCRPILREMSGYLARERPIRVDREGILFSGWIPRAPSPSFTRLVKNQVRIALTKKRIPEQVSFAVTGRCPCDCVFCCAKGIRAEPELTLEEIQSAIRQAVEMGAHLLTFDGGETLLRQDIFQIVRFGKETGSTTVLFTNGLYLTADTAACLKEAGLDTIQVSIDSPYAEEHDRIRGVKGIFQKAIRGAEEAVRAGLTVSLYCVARPENTGERTLEDLLNLANRLGAHEVSLYDILAIGKWLDREADTLTERDRKRAIELHCRVNRPGGEGAKVMAFSFFESPERFGCMAGRRWIHITPAGDVIPCSYTPLTFGNVRREPLRVIWKRIRRHPEYRTEGRSCMVQDRSFRKKYVYSIPEHASLPFPVCREAAETVEPALELTSKS